MTILYLITMVSVPKWTSYNKIPKVLREFDFMSNCLFTAPSFLYHLLQKSPSSFRLARGLRSDGSFNVGPTSYKDRLLELLMAVLLSEMVVLAAAAHQHLLLFMGRADYSRMQNPVNEFRFSENATPLFFGKSVSAAQKVKEKFNDISFIQHITSVSVLKLMFTYSMNLKLFNHVII